MNADTLSSRLKLAMQEAGYTQSKLAEVVGLSQGAIQKLTTGKAASTTRILEIANALRVNPSWLSNGSGEMRINPSKESNIGPESEWARVDAWDSDTPLPDDEVEVPFLKDIEFACGDGRISDEDYNGFMLRFSKATLRRVGANTDGSGVLCFPARGNSMEPIIPDGTTVAVDCNNKKVIDGKLYAINQDGLKRIKMLHLLPGGKIGVRSFNKAEYPDEEIDKSGIEIIGRVFWYSVLL